MTPTLWPSASSTAANAGAMCLNGKTMDSYRRFGLIAVLFGLLTSIGAATYTWRDESAASLALKRLGTSGETRGASDKGGL